MKKLLITGFDPFGEIAINPAWEAVQLLPDVVADFELCKLNIPTVFGVAAQMILDKARDVLPDVILCIGLAAGREAVTPERIAVNIRDAKIPDNAGNQPQGDFVDIQGPAAYFSTLPVQKISQAIRDAGIPSSVSNSAGAYVCNDVLYTLLHAYAGTSVKVGFIHVPQLPQQGSPSMALETNTQALQIAIANCLP